MTGCTGAARAPQPLAKCGAARFAIFQNGRARITSDAQPFVVKETLLYVRP